MSNKKFNCELFKERVLELMKAQSITIKQITKDREGEISFAWFTKLKQNKIKSPSADIVFMLANYFNVSADYLLGLSNIPTQDAELKAVCEYTGLSQEAIIAITCPFYGGTIDKTIINKIIESMEFLTIAHVLTEAQLNKDFLLPNADYVIESIKSNLQDEQIPQMYRKALSIVGVQGMASSYKQDLTECICSLFEKIVKYKKELQHEKS